MKKLPTILKFGLNITILRAYSRLNDESLIFIKSVGSDDLLVNVWEKLYKYESKDLIKRLYNEKHSREISEEKASQIVSNLIHGRECFKSASQASDVVRPVLLYNGVLSLSRGLILFLDINASETSLSNSSGLGVLDWSNTLSNGIGEIPNLKIKSCEGTFKELLNVTRNTYSGFVYTAPYPKRIYFKKSLGDMNIKQLSIKDILSRIPELSQTFIDVFNELPNCYESHIFTLNKDTHSDISIFDTTKGLPKEDVLIKQFNLPSDIDIRYKDSHHFFGDIYHMYFRIKHKSEEEYVRIMPQIKISNEDKMFIIAPFEDGTKLSPLMNLFLVSLFMGMLVRYYPTYWLSLINRSNANGDFTYPILIKSINLIENEFPKMILNELETGETYNEV